MLHFVEPSGCGKSSLVRAGLLPIMARDPGWLTAAAEWCQRSPSSCNAGSGACSRSEGVAALDWTVSSVRARLNDDDGLTALCDDLLVAARGVSGSVLLVVDQFEEMLTRWPLRRRGAISRAYCAPRSPARAGRGDAPPGVSRPALASPELRDLTADTYALRPLSHDALRTVIEEPARVAGFSVDPGLVTQLVEDTR